MIRTSQKFRSTGQGTPDVEFVSVQGRQLITVVKRGERTVIPVEFRIRSGYHIMADQGTDRSILYSKLTVTGGSSILLGNIQYPDPSDHVPVGLKEKTGVFLDTVTMCIPVEVKRETRKGLHRIYGRLFYQACDSTKCYFPRELLFEVAIHVK